VKQDTYPNLFKGIGKLKDKTVKLHINGYVKPVAQRYRRTPFNLCNKVEKENTKLLNEDITEKVENESTPCISPIVTPSKKNPEEIRISIECPVTQKTEDQKTDCGVAQSI
jgi:hypothetical protein